MKKVLKKSLFVFIIFLSALYAGLFLPSKIINNATAEGSLNTYNFVIKNNLINEQSFISLSISNETSSSLILSNNLNCFDEAISAITQNIEADGNSFENSLINIIFDDFVFFKDDSLNIECGNFVFSGQITSAYEQSVFIINSQEDINILFENIIISSKAKNIVNIKNITTSSIITIKNSSFESTCDNSYAFFFENSPCKFSFSQTNTHSSTFMLNFKIGLNILFDDFQQVLTKIKITLPENLNKTVVLNNINQTITKSFEFFAETDIYTLEPLVYWESKKMLFSSKYNLSHNLNGGSSQTQAPDSIIYGNKYNLPTNLSKPNNEFTSWFGCITLDGKIYYFDTQMLSQVSNNNFEPSLLKNIFATSLQDVSNNHSITTLFDTDNDDNYQISSQIIKLYNRLNQIPTLIAKWEYKISFDTCGGDNLTAITCSIDSNIDNLPIPTKTGYTFDGWYIDESLLSTVNLSQIKENICLYAKWNVNQYRISYFYEYGSEPITTLTFNYGELISHAALSKTGYHQTGWILEDGSTFSATTMPAENIKLFPVWQKNQYITYFISDGNEIISPIISEYLAPISEPDIPTKTGYTFNKWIDSDTNLPFDFSTTPSKEFRTAIATWTANNYKATFMYSDIGEQDIAFETELSIIPIKTGYKFLGWYDYNGNKITSMPAYDIVLYPSWQEKQIVEISLNKQTNYISDENFGFKISSSLSNFIVEYFVSDNWTTAVPQDIGTYNIKITRLEDENYAAFETTILNGYEILPNKIELKYAIVIMFALFFIEICFIIVVRWLIHQKKNAPMLMSTIILPFAMFETSEFITAIIALTCVIIGMIWLIHDLVILHYTTPDKSMTSNKYDISYRNSQVEDHSNDIDIEQNVEDLLIKNNLIKPSERKNHIKENTDKD